MADITITVPNAVLSRVLDAIAATKGYKPSDGTKAQFARNHIAAYIKDIVKSYEGSAASANARRLADTAVDSEITIT